MNTKYGIAQTVGSSVVIRTDLPAFATVSEAADYIATELFDFSLSNHYVTPVKVGA